MPEDDDQNACKCRRRKAIIIFIKTGVADGVP
jgi:hypothetical protein